METFYPARNGEIPDSLADDALSNQVILNIKTEEFCNEFSLS